MIDGRFFNSDSTLQEVFEEKEVDVELYRNGTETLAFILRNPESAAKNQPPRTKSARNDIIE